MTITQNVSSGKWAVAMVAWHGWMREDAIGDGITSALSALVTRCDTEDEAKTLAAALNDEQPTVMPGGKSVPVYGAMKYAKRDYIGRQAREQNGNRDADRNIIHLPR